MGSPGLVCSVLVMSLVSSEYLRVTGQASGRSKRSIQPDQPRIITQDGHLIFQSGINHNITFKAGNGGGFLLNNIDLYSAVTQAQQTKTSVDRLSAAFGTGSTNLTSRVSALENSQSSQGSSRSRIQQLSRRINRVQTNLGNEQNSQDARIINLESRFPGTVSLANLNMRLTNVTSRVRSLERSNSGSGSTSGSRGSRRSRRRNRGNRGSRGGRFNTYSPRAFRRLRNRVRTLETAMQSLQTLLTTNECASSPCQNGGTCIDMYNGYMCRCTREWQGPQCTQDINECYIYAGTDLGCQNGATCINTHGGFSCQCPPNYHGVHCRETHDDCTGASTSELCGHGVCVNIARPVSGQPRYNCICDEGWTNSGSDPACTVDVNECQGHTHCSVDPLVQCVNIPGSYICGSCPAGFTGNGFACADVNECQLNNGGCSISPMVECINTRGSSRCGSCPPGYQGDGRSCTYVGACSSNNGGCHSQAQCLEDGNGLRTGCTCPLGYAGTGIGPSGCIPSGEAGGCASNPCHNGGTCQPAGMSGFSCSCVQGFNGPTCDGTVDACASNPCQNGGTCTQGSGGTFTCECSADYTGTTCTEQQEACGGYLNGESGSLRYPRTVNVSYSDRLNCAWVITTTPNKILMVVFSEFHLENHPTCNYDFLQIHDGSSASAHNIGKFCGTSLPNGGIINSTSNTMYMWFRTDHSLGGDGFNIHWTSHNPVCGGHLDGSDHGEFDSPGYPGQYPHNRDCVWTVAVSPGNNIVFSFAHLSLEEHSSCNFDYLEIRDGETEEATLLGRYCSSQTPPPVTTTGPFAFVRFHSDSSASDTGFHITYHIDNLNPGCGEALTGNEGTVQSPNYPNPYDEGLQCVWTITSDPNTRIRLTFSILDMESSTGCEFDSVVVRDGSDQTGDLLGSFCGTVNPAPLTSTENVLFIEMRSDSSMNGAGFQATWSTACGGNFIGQSGQITSPGWPLNYPDNQNCLYVITVPEPNTVLLNITDFHLEDEEDCDYDYLEFYDGEDTSAPVIHPRLCGPLLTTTVRSSGDTLTVKFYSDSSNSHLGFRAFYQAQQASEETGCGEVINTDANTGMVQRSRGSATTPGTPCEWVITVPPGSAVRLLFYLFHFPAFSNGTCGDAGLTVEDMINQGLGITRRPFGTYCGQRAPSLTSTANQIALRMTAQENAADQYFVVSYVRLNTSTDCGGDLTDISGIITSPNYPENYPHNIQCVWTITVPQNHQIRLNLTDFDIEHVSSCFYDGLEVRNGAYSTSPLLHTYCGYEMSYFPIISHGNHLYLKFYTDGSASGRGFSIHYDSGASGCGGQLTTHTGGFISPNWPGAYSHNTECFWTITVSQGSNIVLSFDAFDLEHSSTCSYDFVEVREASPTGTLLGKYCGSNLPGPVISTSNKLWVRYRTDSDTSAGGFSAQYSADCNRNITGRSGVIESPNFPDPYPDLINCTWVITAPPGNRVNVSFASLNLEDHSTCNFDVLRLLDGPSASSPGLLEVCGGHTLPADTRSTGRFMTVHFQTDFSVSYHGFRLEWVVDGCGGQLTGNSGTLRSPGYPNNYPNHLLCEWTIEVPVGKKIKLTITDFDVEMHSTCNYDALEVYAGPDSDGPRLVQLCHTHMPETNQEITGPGNKLFVRFFTDSSASGRGFSIDYTAIDGGCGGNFSALESTFLSPNYPNNYDNSLDCEWLITVAEGHTVELTFNTFNVEGSHYDHVTLYDGPSVSSNQVGYLTGLRSSPVTYKSNSNVMLVRFFTDSSEQRQGFNATYRTACGGTLNADRDGAIQSPHIATILMECVWHIISQTSTNRVSLTFTNFGVAGNCESNYVSLADSLDPAITESSEVQHSLCGNSLPPMYTSRGSALTVVMNTTNINNIQFRAVYTSSDSACGGNFTAVSGRFNSPNYPDMYPANIECVWQVITAPGNSLTLSFDEFQLDPDGGFYDDYVEIYSPDLNGALQGRFYGNTLPTNLTLMHGVWVKFRSNTDEFRGQGFRAQWNHVYPNDLTGDSGQIGSPGNPYQNLVDFRWTITVAEGKRIRITFNHLNIESEEGLPCYFYDFLKIYDGSESDQVSLGFYCGNILPEPIESVNNMVSLLFHTTLYSGLSGFLLTWNAVVTDASASNGTSAFTPSGCGTQLYATHAAQNFTSPNYPENYPSSTTCEWVITVSEGHRIQLSFPFIDLEEHGACVWDNLMIYDGGPVGVGTLRGTFCGSVSPDDIISQSSVVIVRFSSDFDVTGLGFVIQYRQACGGTRTDVVGIIQTPGYPQNYGDNLSCLFNVRVPQDRTIRVAFNSPFGIARGQYGNCSADYLQLLNGLDESSPPMVVSGSTNTNGRFCGSSAPSGVIETSSNFLTAKFISDFGTSGPGFSFNYTERHYACGGQILLTGAISSGYFTSPNYPDPYPQNVDCKWSIIAPASHRIQVDFEDSFYIEPHPNCDYDYVEFHDGGTLNAPRIGDPVCGNHLPGSVLSTANVLLARFRTDDSVVRQGFKARYSIATCGGRITVGATADSLTFPNSLNTNGPYLDCFWVIQGPVGHYLTINITQMQLENSPDCSVASLEIIDPGMAPNNASITLENPETSPAVRGLSVAEARANASGGSLYRGCGQPYFYPPGSNSFETADNRAYIWFKSDSQDSQSGFQINFSASLEECGGRLTASSGVLTSPNYPNPYAHRRVCVWEISVPRDRKIRLTFTDFALERSAGGVCRYDYVQVNNGLLPSSPYLGRFCGVDLPPSISSSGHTMKVKFQADHSITHGGFRAEYSSDEEADCGGVLTDSPGTLTSPNFTRSRHSNHYDHSVQCIWEIENPQVNSSIQFLFLNIDLEYHIGCANDFVQFREGVGQTAPVIGRFCGNYTTNQKHFRSLTVGSPRFVIPTPNAWVVFISDSSINGNGFRVAYTFQPCGGVITEPSGVLTSPNYPDGYDRNVDCAWLLRAPQGMVIKINVTDFRFERHTSCDYDFFEIQNGGDYDSPTIGRYCTNMTVPPFQSQGNEVRLVMSTNRFTGRGSNNVRGFRLEYSFDHPGCGGHLSGFQGSLSSPNFPSSYPDNTECIWDITVEPGYHVSLTFNPPFDVSCNDFVKVYDVLSNGTFRQLGSFCHNTVPAEQRSSLTKMRVVFQSDAATNGNGFSADFTSACGGVITSDNVEIVSPGFPGYRNNMRCFYSLQPSGEKILSLLFRQFRLEAHPSCDHDYLRVYSGNSSNGNLLANLCSDLRPAMISQTGQLFLDFKTDSSVTYRGFRVTYRAEACGGNFTGSRGRIKTPGRPADYLNNLDCIFNLTVDPGLVVRVRFYIFELQTSSNCHADYVAIYDGNTLQAPLIGKFCGERASLPSVIQSTGNTMVMRFVSDHSISDGGFYGRYDRTYGPEAGCGGTLQQTSGTIRSFDSDNDGEYENNLSCDWNVIVEPNKRVLFNITDMNLYGHSRRFGFCSYDYVEIFDGPTELSPVILRKCDSVTPVIVRSSSNSVLFRFHTSRTRTGAGFNATFIQEDTQCGGAVLNATDGPQTLTSPGYPSPSQVGLRCMWTIDSGSVDQQVSVSVENLQLEADCSNDYLAVQDKPMGNHGMNHKLCTGLDNPHLFYSRHRQVNIIYHQDSTTSPGFFLTYQRAGCSRVYTASEGRITSPTLSDSDEYAHNLNCVLQINAPEGTYLSFYFEEFHLEGSENYCRFDHLVIAGGNFISPQLCGNTLPSSVHIQGPNATLTLTTDSSVSYLGYAITYVASTTGPGCGGNLTHAIPGLITSPQYPGTPDGPLECVWHLNTAARLRLSLKVFGASRRPRSRACPDSYVQLTRMVSSTRRRARTYCWNMNMHTWQASNVEIKYFVGSGNFTAATFKLRFSYFDGVL